MNVSSARRWALSLVVVLGVLPETTMAQATCTPSPSCEPAACAPTATPAVESATCAQPAASCGPSNGATCSLPTGSSCGAPDFIPFDPVTGSGPARTGLELVDLGPILEPVRAVFRVPGMAAAVIRDGRLHAIGTAGIRRVGSDQPLTVDDPFHLGSCGKAVTATVAAALVDQGLIEWDRTIAEAFPELASAARAEYLGVTLRQLLSHRGGFASRSGAFDDAIAGFRGELSEQRAELVRYSVATAPAYEPGTAFHYSDIGYCVAGAMLERATGKPWEELVEAYLAEPMNLQSLGFGAPGAMAPESAPRGHLLTEAGLVALGVGPGEDLANPSIGPAGTIHMSLRDWATFAQLQLRGARGEEVALLSKAAFSELHGDSFHQGYGLGWFLAPSTWGSGTALTHSGSCGAWTAVLWILPEQNAALLLATNYGGGSGSRALQLAAERIGEEFLRP